MKHQNHLTGLPTLIGAGLFIVSCAATTTKDDGVLMSSALEPASPIGSWDFQEGAGLVTRDGTGNQDGQLSSAGVAWTTRPAGGGALDFTSGYLSSPPTGYVSVPTTPALNAIRDGVTLCARIRASNYPQGWASILSRQDTTDFRETYGLYLNNGSVTFVTNAPDIVPFAAALPLNEWTHVCASYDSVSQKAVGYTNCQPTDRGDNLQGTLGNQTNNPLIIGGNRNFDQPVNEIFPGAIDDVRIYDRVLRPDEVALFCPAPKPKCPVGDFPVSIGQVPAGVGNSCNRGSTIYRFAPQVTPLRNGNLLAIYRDGSSACQFMVGRVFSPDGAAITQEFVIARDAVTALVTPLEGGNFAVATDAYLGLPVSTKATIQVFDSNGVPVTPVSDVNMSATTTANVSDTKPLPAGGFVVTFTQAETINPGGLGRPDVINVRARVYSSAGVALGNDFLVDSQTGPVSVQSAAKVIPLASGFLVTWGDSNGQAAGAGVQTRLRGRIFDALGAPLGPDLLLSDSATVFEYRFVGLAGGGFALVWSDYATWDGTIDSLQASLRRSLDIRARTFDSNGLPVGPTDIALSTEAGEQSHPSVAPLSNGGFVTVWQSGSPANGFSVHGRVVGGNGVAAGGDFIAAQLQDIGDQAAPQVTALPGGRFAAAWIAKAAPGVASDGTATARVFDSSGAPVSGNVELQTTTVGSTKQRGALALTTLTGGRFAASWAVVTTNGNNDRVGDTRARIVDASGDTIYVDAGPGNQCVQP